MINLGQYGQYPVWVIILITIWVIPWKGYSLWIAANKKQKVWFIILLIVNTFAIVEIIYIFYIAKISPSEIFGKKKVEEKKEEPKVEENQNGQ